MGLTNENVGPKILAKIKIYVLTRAELLFTLCYEIPCNKKTNPDSFWQVYNNLENLRQLRPELHINLIYV